MIISKYQEYLKSQKWNDIKKLVFKRDKYICQGCLTETKNLQAHHLTYDRIYNEMCFDLITLCRKCHCNIHNIDSVDDYLEKYKVNKNETIYRLNGSVIVGYKDELADLLMDFMRFMDTQKIKSYFGFLHCGTIYLSSYAYASYTKMFGLGYKDFLNIDEYEI